MTYRWPLMANNLTLTDRQAAARFFLSDANMTHGDQVRAFEGEFAAWLGVKYAVMVNSGSSANLLSMHALKLAYGCRTVLVPVITWVSDIASVLHAGMEPIFCDVDPENFGINYWDAPFADAAFVTHCLGFDGMPNQIDGLVVEDCCEALGARKADDGAKLGSSCLMSNFSFYYSHHLTTIEGGMICTDDAGLYQLLRRLRSHGLAREMTDEAGKANIAMYWPDLDPSFTFMEAAWNVRPIEVQAVIGRTQLKTLDVNNAKRTSNLQLFLSLLDPERFQTKYPVEGSCSFALPLVLQAPDSDLMAVILRCLENNGVEYRRGTVGGGNQMRQPYARARWGWDFHKRFPRAEHLHEYGLFIGNYPTLDQALIEEVCDRLNRLAPETLIHVPV